jgi:ABC-type multidrug transport system fused ATPase/permease subunit
MNALRVVKVYNRQEHEIEHYQQSNRALLKQNLRITKIEAATNPLLDVMGMVAMCGAILLGAAWVSGQYSQLQSSEFFVLIAMLGVAAESVRKVSEVWNNVQQANAAAERVFAVIDECQEHEDPEAFELKPLTQNIEFKKIVFTYPGAAQPSLQGIDLSVPAGQTVAVVGPNGSGKTTLVNLIPRFYDPDSGQILIDGQDIHKATLYSLRDQIGMVTQNVVTFHDTIANNISYGKPDATMDQIVQAAKQAYAHEFIEPLPDGYQTIIGENSTGFSGGQLQRMVIARAILKNPRILIFDEAMSQVDADSEAKIHAALQQIMKGRTCFVIAHRFSTVITADRIVVVDQGRIVAQGKHEELIQTSDVYKRLYETQLMGTSKEE